MLCQQTLELLISNYGAEAGNLAIKTLCFGGLYVAGGVAPRVCEFSTPWKRLFFQSTGMQNIIKMAGFCMYQSDFADGVLQNIISQ